MIVGTQQLENFAIPPIWLTYPTVSKHCYPYLDFSPHNSKILPTFHHGIFSDWYLLIPLSFGDM